MNSPLLLPPRGIFVPTGLIFHEQLPSATLLTWLKLRCLAWRGWHTPALTLPELASLLGVHPDRLQRHLYQLQDEATLSWQVDKLGRLVISFPEEPYKMNETQLKTSTSDKLPPSYPGQSRGEELGHYFPEHILGYLSYLDDEPEPDYYFVSSFEQAFIKDDMPANNEYRKP